MANGQYFNNPIFDYELPNTRRRITNVTTTDKYVQLTMTRAMTAAPVGEFVWVRFTEKPWLNGYWRVRWKSGVNIRLDKQGTGETYTRRAGFIPPISAQVWYVDALGSENSPSETRRLSALKYNTALKAATRPYLMCGIQNRVYNFLRTFYLDPEVRLEYRAKYATHKEAWDSCGYGPSGDYALDKIVNAFMCTVTSASESEGPSGTCWDKNKVRDMESGDTLRGLWQISSDLSELPWYPSEGNESLLFIPEYSTRAAIWLMYQRLFDTDDTLDYDQKPFVAWFQSMDADPTYHACSQSNSNNRVNGCCPGLNAGGE